MLIGAIIAAVIAIAMSIYSYVQMRKMQKKNRPKPNQIDGTIADEGVSFCDIAGSPHIHPNITDLWNKKSEAIKQKSGGFLGIGKSSQVTGYRYYTCFAAFIGNRIEKFIAINFDNRGWIVHDPTKHPFNMLPVNKPSLFGQDAGGVVGNIDIELGFPQPQQNLAYKQHFDLVSAYPYQSYLVFRGNTVDQPFYFGNSNYMKEMLLWVKRIHVKNDGGGQWYDEKSEIPKTSYVSRGSKYMPFSVSMNTICYSSAEDGVGFGEFTLPMYEQEISYGVKFLGGGLIGNGQPVGSNPSLVASASFIENKGLPAISGGTAIPSLDWKYDNFPKYDDYVFDSSAERKFKGSGNFYWGGGAFSYKAVTSGNNATLQIKKEGNVVLSVGASIDPRTWIYHEGELNLAAGLYQIEFDAGERYRLHHDPRPLIYFIVKLKEIKEIEHGDMNPIHKIREILTDDTAMAKPEIDVNDINFRKAADRIWDEGLGVSWAIDEKSCIDAIEELCYHIEAGIRVNRQTGLYEMVLFRDDWFAEDEIHTIVENKIKDLSLEVMNSDDIVNQLNVTYFDRERIKNSTFSVYENGSILTMGKANAESIDFPYFMNMRNAEIVANWKLKQYSTPAWKGTFTTGWREARKWNRYDLVEITWSKKWQGTILARIMKIDLGNGLNNEVMIDFEEVVPYSGEMNTSIVVDDSTEIKPMPPQSAIFKTFEIPYYDLAQLKTQAELDLELARNPNIGFVAAVAGRPQQNSIDAQLHTESDVGYELVSSVGYASFARTDEAVNRTQQSFVVKNEDLSVQFKQDSLIMLGDEIVIYKSYDAETKTLTVERGALDTIPQNHIENTVLYFYDDAFAYDPEGYTPPKTVNATVLTTTPSGIESLETSPKRQIEIESRAIRPYPPANVKINGEYWPDEVNGNPILTWVNRNRIQQTGGSILGWFDGGVALEPGVTYQLIVNTIDASNAETEFLNVNVGTVNTYIVDLSTAPSSAKQFKIVLYAVRDGYESLQRFEHYVVKPLTAPQNLTATYNPI